MPTVVNLTPHPINIQLPDGSQVVYPRYPGPAARVNNLPLKDRPGLVLGVPVRPIPVSQGIDGLPRPAPDTVYLVSLFVLAEMRRMGSIRTDVFAPATGPEDGAVRAYGQTVAVTRLLGL
jgi:hypothetical protein